MSIPLPGAKKTARRALRDYRHAMRGAAKWARLSFIDPEVVRVRLQSFAGTFPATTVS